MNIECVVDTMVIQKCNASITKSPRANSEFVKRVSLLTKIQKKNFVLLMSPQLLHEYKTQIKQPRNDFIRAFFELLTRPDATRHNWRSPWRQTHKDDANLCGFPNEDLHVLRTAVKEDESLILTEEIKMLESDECIKRKFKVKIRKPWN